MHDTHFRLLMSFALVGAMAATSGCGGDDDGAECGAGTVEVEGVCLPAAEACAAGTVYQPETRSCESQCMEGTIRQGDTCVNPIDCGTGTAQMGDECVPDGSVVCGGNTVFDADNGVCVPDPDAICEGDLVYVVESATCVDPDTLLEGMADVSELAEPNDPTFNDAAMAQPVDISDGGGSFWGCVEPADFNMDGVIDPDRDFFSVTVTEPTVLDVNLIGLNGLSPAIGVLPADEELDEAGWIRFVFELASARPQKKILLPRAGEYLLLVTDASALLGAFLEAGFIPTGGPGRCYFGQLTPEALPEPTPITVGTPIRGTFGDPVFYAYTTEDANAFIGATVSELNAMGEPANRGTHDAATTLFTGSPVQFRGTAFEAGGGRATVGAAVPTMGTQVVVAVEQVLSLTTETVSYEVGLSSVLSQPVPDGPVTITHDDAGVAVGAPTANSAIFSFEGTSGDIARVVFDSGESEGDFDVYLLSPSGTRLFLGRGDCQAAVVDDFFGPVRVPGCAEADSYVELVETGPYTLAVYNYDGTDGEDYSVDLAVTQITPVALTRGTAASTTLSADEPAFFRLDARTADWLEFAATNAMNITAFDTQLHPSTGAFAELVSNDGATTESFERFYGGMGSRLIISVANADGNSGDESFDFTVSDVAFTDLGSVTAAMPVTRAGETAPADSGLVRYIVRAETPGETLTLTVTGEAAVDVLINRHSAPTLAITSTVDDNGAGEAEELELIVPSGGVTVIFTVADVSDVGGMFDIGVSSEPPPYSFAGAAVAFTSVCPSEGGAGTQHLDDVDDELTAAIALPGDFPFTFFGEGKTEFLVSSNGWMTFDTTATNSCFSSTTGSCPSQGDLIAPLWRDLDEVSICTARDADRFIVEWRGVLFNSTTVAELQAILHTSGRIDLVYGPAHAAPRGAGVIGVRNADASITLGPTPTDIAADSSYTFTPAP